MAQIFGPSADTWLRLVNGGLVLLVVALLLFLVLIGSGTLESTYSTGVAWVTSQPVQFSHKHHAGELGIDCRYCHTGVETSADAGLPPTHICMTCHSQIWTDAPELEPVRQSFATGKPIAWNRVAQLPDFVFFNHSIHVNRGVPCVTCHGRVDQMPLLSQAEPFQMQWCLSCHRDPAPHLRPPAMVTQMDWSGWTDDASRRFGPQAMQAHAIDPNLLDKCGVCHR